MRTSYLSWLFLISLLMIFFGIDVLVSGQCQSDQKTSLLQIKSNLNFNSSYSVKLVHWNRNTDCCLWPGVRCDAAGRVIELDLQRESISGGIDNSSSLFNLQYLQKLNLAYNSLYYTQIPSKFNKLSNLSYLNLSNACFGGQIPIEIASLTMLETLDLSNDYTSRGSLPLRLENPNLRKLVQNLSKLTDLYLDGVSISAEGKEWGQALSSSSPKLRVLGLSGCNLHGPIDPTLQNLLSLSVIDLSDNTLSAPVPAFVANFSNLTSLDLHSSDLRGTFPENILRIHKLKTLDLSINLQLHGYLPDFQNGTLQELRLRGTSFSGEIPDSIGNLKMLSIIDLSSCNFSGTIPNSIGNLKMLYIIELSGCHFSGTIPNSIGNLKMLSIIDLSGCNFSGTIPNSVANLTELVHLDLSSNRFMGPIPSLSLVKNLSLVSLANNLLNCSILSTDWEVLSHLEHLDLHNNSLSGEIPPSLFSNPPLQILLLSDNQFTGQLKEFPKVSSLQLERLDLGSNKLEGAVPMSVFSFQNLQDLSLSSNNFNDSLLLTKVQYLRNLFILDLSYNNLSTDPATNDSISTSFPQLSALNLASCNLMKFPGFLRNQSGLGVLDLSNNQIHGDIPNWLWEMNLNWLNLSRNFLVNVGAPAHGIMSPQDVLDLHANQLQGQIPIPPPLIQYLDYSSNNFSSIIPATIGGYLSGCYFFSLSSNNLHGSIPHSICKATWLRVLDISNNSLTDTIPKCLVRSLSSVLGVLNLSRNKFNGTIIDKFPSNCGLQTLDLSENSLEGKVPKSLANCEMLEVLNIGNNHVEDTFPSHLESLRSLHVLVLRSNLFHGSINCSENESSWPMLQIVDIASNNFTGKVPRKCLTTWAAMMDDKNQIHNHLRFRVIGPYLWYYQDAVTVTIKGLEMVLQKILTVFTAIDLSCNKFEGPIPEVMGSLKALHSLNMSHNTLIGQIPSSLGNLRQLESLDLSQNNLSGVIPSELSTLNFLSFANFSYNRLVGKIPTGTQLQSFSNASFEGNLGLCGLPLADNCSAIKVPESHPAESNNTYSDSNNDIEWNWISAELGFIFGLGIVFLPLLFGRRWRICYYRNVDRLFCGLLPLVERKY